jgi:hypothetical protein
MPMALKLNGRVKISGRMLGAWCTTARPVGRPQQTIRHAYILPSSSALKRTAKEWMTVARDRSAWGRKVEYKLELPPGSFTNLRRHWTKHERHIDKIGLDRRFNGKKSTTSFRDTRDKTSLRICMSKTQSESCIGSVNISTIRGKVKS